MNADQVAGTIRTLMIFLGGYAAAYGFDAASWSAITGGVVAIVMWLWSMKTHAQK